jgi:hypothetical protein
MSTGGGLGAILGGMQVDPTRLRRGLGDALMSLGAIGLGQDPFSVMQAQKQGRADEEQRTLENKRYDDESAFKKQQFGLRQQQEERLLRQQLMHQQEDQERRQAASEQGKVVAAALFPKEAAAVAQTAQMMQQAQAPQQGLAGMMEASQAPFPYTQQARGRTVGAMFPAEGMSQLQLQQAQAQNAAMESDMRMRAAAGQGQIPSPSDPVFPPLKPSGDPEMSPDQVASAQVENAINEAGYELIEALPRGRYRIRDPKTGRTGTWQP